MCTRACGDQINGRQRLSDEATRALLSNSPATRSGVLFHLLTPCVSECVGDETCWLAKAPSMRNGGDEMGELLRHVCRRRLIRVWEREARHEDESRGRRGSGRARQASARGRTGNAKSGRRRRAEDRADAGGLVLQHRHTRERRCLCTGREDRVNRDDESSLSRAAVCLAFCPTFPLTLCSLSLPSISCLIH